ncbi:MAG: DNA methyltransferase [Candidatus Thorarchaeota archaeon]
MSTLGLKDYQENRGVDGVYDKRNTLNNLTGKQWLFSTKTVIPKAYSSERRQGNIEFKSPLLPEAFCQEIIETFSKPGETVLDPSPGLGTTMLGIHLANSGESGPNRKYIGIQSDDDLIKENLSLLRQRNELSGELMRETMDSLANLPQNSVDLIFSDIPIVSNTSLLDPDRAQLSPSVHSEAKVQLVHELLAFFCPVILEAVKKLKINRYLVLTLPETIESGYPALNFTLSSLFVHNFQLVGLPLKAERIWFIPEPQKGFEEFITISRRILVFRNEEGFLYRPKQFPALFNGQIPIGRTEIIHKAYPPSFNHKLRSQHGGMKPPELCQLLIERYSDHRNDLVLDPFVGVGGTLLGASLSGRKAIGIDINAQWREIYHQVTHESGFPEQEFIVGDSRAGIPDVISDGSAGLILTDVPYWAMDKLKKTRGRYSRAGEESKGKLHSSLKRFNQADTISLGEWKSLLNDVFTLCYPKLAPNKYCVVFIGNMYRTIIEERAGKARKIGKYLMLSSILARILLEIGYQFEREIIWYSPDKSLHVFGYPYSYIPSIVHQSILVFNKGK